MSKIQSRGNKSTELRFRSLLIRAGLNGWCVQPKEVVGRPDFAFLKLRLVIFIDSCFWHGCPTHVRYPKSNKHYWRKKILANRKRDSILTKKLRKEGWSVFRVWEHDLASEDKVLRRLNAFL
jgi:DNA mismatch endonuclease (patch repair protein)